MFFESVDSPYSVNRERCFGCNVVELLNGAVCVSPCTTCRLTIVLRRGNPWQFTSFDMYLVDAPIGLRVNRLPSKLSVLKTLRKLYIMTPSA